MKSGATPLERLQLRADLAAVEIFERILRRQRWSAADKEALAEFLFRFVMAEFKHVGRRL